MPYLKISYEAPGDVWVKLTDGDACDPECWPDICDAVNSNADVEIEYGEPVDELPDGVTAAWDLT